MKAKVFLLILLIFSFLESVYNSFQRFLGKNLLLLSYSPHDSGEKDRI